jgi:hypothetical protein
MKFRSVILPSTMVAAAASAQPAPARPPAGELQVALTNSGGTVVSAVYVAPSGSPDFSDDLLGKQVASVGKTVHVKIKDPSNACVFDVQFLLADGATITRKGVNLCQSDTYTLTR